MFGSPSTTATQTGRHPVRSALAFVSALLCVLLLLGGSVLLPSRWNNSHAAGPGGLTFQSPRCAEQANAQNCENKDPIDAHCTQDAQTMASRDVVYRQHIIGRVDARFSDLCRTAWTRAISYPGTTVAWVNALTVNLTANAPRSSGNDTRSQTDGTLETYTNMVFGAPFSSSGQFILSDGNVIAVTVHDK